MPNNKQFNARKGDMFQVQSQQVELTNLRSCAEAFLSVDFKSSSAADGGTGSDPSVDSAMPISDGNPSSWNPGDVSERRLPEIERPRC